MRPDCERCKFKDRCCWYLDKGYRENCPDWTESEVDSDT